MRILGESLYLSPIIEAHVDGLAEAWEPLNYVPHTEESRIGFLARALRQNEMFDWGLGSRSLITLTVLSKDTDEVMGYTVIKALPEHSRVDFQFTILKQEYRGTGNYSELNILRHKYVYQESSPINETWIRLSEGEARQAGTLQSLYSDLGPSFDIIDRGSFAYSCITRQQWQDWINQDSQTQKREALFILEE